MPVRDSPALCFPSNRRDDGRLVGERMHKVYLRALAASAFLCTQAVWAAAPLPPPVDQQLARDMLKSLVELNTTHAYGSTEAAKAIQGWLLTAGFAPSDVVRLAPPDHPTQGRVVA